MAYASWERFAFALGYLANEAHYRNKNDRGLIELHFESNDVQGAWGKEGRIQYYGKENYLALRLADWYYTKSAGNGSITCRMTIWESKIYSDIIQTAGMNNMGLCPGRKRNTREGSGRG